jgi:hypothetical protein
MPTGSLCAERNVIGTALGKKNDLTGFTSCILLTQASISLYFLFSGQSFFETPRFEDDCSLGYSQS